MADPTNAPPQLNERRARPLLRYAALSIFAAVLSVVLKFAAYRIAHSIGLLSDEIESTANIVTAVTALFAIWYAAQPADTEYQYGHKKIEFFAGGLEGAMIVFAAAAIASTAVRRLYNPIMPEELGTAFVLVAISTVVNCIVGLALVRTGRKVESIALEADGRHLMSDVWTSVAVVCGLVAVQWTKRPWIDPLIALLVALNILRVGILLVHRSFDGLMDRALTLAENEKIVSVIRDFIKPKMAFHALRTRRAGSRRFMGYRLLVPGDSTVREAHDCEMAIGREIRSIFPEIQITAHIEPIEDRRAWNDYEPATKV